MPEKIAFILSTARTGTKTLAEGLAGEDVSSPHQPPFSRFLTIISNYHLHGWVPKRVLEWLVVHLRERQILAADCRYYIQVYSLDYLPAKIISQRYTNVRIIHIVRDPRTFVRSYLNWVHTRFKSFVANKLVLGWHPSGYFTGAFSLWEWLQMDEFQRVCWHWMYKNTLLEQLFQDDERYMRVRFEDLFQSPDSGVLETVLLFVGLSHQTECMTMLQKGRNVSRKTYFPSWQAWTPKQKHQLLDICGEKMRQYGYSWER